jgi:hypothetical protein
MAGSNPQTPERGGAFVQGAEPYKPKLTQTEILEELQKVSGIPTPLRDLREELPIARPRQSEGPEPGLRKIAEGGALSTEERGLLVDQALLLLRELYAHLALKRALHAIDPIQRLQLLRLRLEGLAEREFHSELLDIFVSLRDLHTTYTLPYVYWPKFAFLPFRVEEYYIGEARRYLISSVSPQNQAPGFKAGLEITHWNGSPIDFVVARNAAREGGSNPEARRARGLEALTLRSFAASLPPDEDWVTLTCIDEAGEQIESRHDWKVVTRDDLSHLLAPDPKSNPTAVRALGVDVKTELLRRVRKALFDPPAMRVEAEVAGRSVAAPLPENLSLMPDVYPRFGAVTTPSGRFGYIRLATFAPPDDNVGGAVEEFVRLLKIMPESGLILDVRGNGGGLITFGERILQTLTPRAITPEPFHFATTAFTLQLAHSEGWLAEWREPLATALATGAGFSQGFPVTSPQSCNDLGQIYQGPVVLVTDAFCYSTTDIFAAGFQDHDIGLILGCHGNTGAGGANVWGHELLKTLQVPDNPFVKLPGGAEMRVSARRSTRVGRRSGVPLEDLGVIPDERHFMTRADLLEHNVDLIVHAGELLADKVTCALRLSPIGAAPLKRVAIRSRNIDRVDILVDGRPLLTADVVAEQIDLDLPRPAAKGASIRAQGYRQGALVSSARMTA